MNRFANPYQRQQHAKTVDILQCACWFPEEQQDKLAAVARWTAVLTPLLKMHCRWQTDVHIQLKVSHNSSTWLLPGLFMTVPNCDVPCCAELYCAALSLGLSLGMLALLCYTVAWPRLVLLPVLHALVSSMPSAHGRSCCIRCSHAV
jgi:hypothetical protein